MLANKLLTVFQGTDRRYTAGSLTLFGEEFLSPSDVAQLVFVLFTIAVFTVLVVILGQNIGGAFAVARSCQVRHSLALV